MKTAGIEIQEACNEAINPQTPHVRFTSAFKLPCKYVDHVLCSPEDKLHLRIKEALEFADSVLNVFAVALPTLGTGKFFLVNAKWLFLLIWLRNCFVLKLCHVFLQAREVSFTFGHGYFSKNHE